MSTKTQDTSVKVGAISVEHRLQDEATVEEGETYAIIAEAELRLVYPDGHELINTIQSGGIYSIETQGEQSDEDYRAYIRELEKEQLRELKELLDALKLQVPEGRTVDFFTYLYEADKSDEGLKFADLVKE